MKKIKILWLLLFIIITLICISSASCTAYALNESAESKTGFIQQYAKPNEPLEVDFESEASYIWYVDGQKIANTQKTYTPTENDLQKMIEVKIYQNKKQVSSASIFVSELPVIYIETENGKAVESKDDYISGSVKIQGNEKYEFDCFDVKTSIKGHGNSTWKWFPKKAYKLKLDKKTNLFKMGKNKHWLLIANYIDESNLRNALSVSVADALGAQKLDYVFVDVVFNGKSAGLYQLYEQAKISSDRIDIFDWESAAGDIAEAVTKKEGQTNDFEDNLSSYLEENYSYVTTGKFTFEGKEYTVSDYYDLPSSRNGGFLFEIDFQYDEISRFTTNTGAPVMFKSPEYICSDTQWFSEVQTSVQTFENAICSPDHHTDIAEVKTSYFDLCDEDSLFSYFLTNEILVSEAFAKSTYFYKDIDGKFVFGPIWDFDWSSDNVAPFGTTNPEKWVTLDGRWWIGSMATDPYFAVKVRELYSVNRGTLVSFLSENGEIDKLSSYVRSSALHNQELWQYSRGFEEDLNCLKSWLEKRFAWIDGQFASDVSALQSFGGSISSEITLSATDATLTNEGYVITDKALGSITVNVNAPVSSNLLSYYINGRYKGEAPVINGKASFNVPSEALTEKGGKKNVITVFTDGQISFLTVKYESGDTQFVTLTFADKDQVSVVNVIKNDTVYLALPKSCTNENYFKGWNDGGRTYNANIFFTASSSVVFNAMYEKCNDGSPVHSFEKAEDGYYCEKCDTYKEDLSIYTSVYNCVITQSSRYGTKYTGKHAAPKITVTLGDKTLTANTDYTISFKNDVLPGFATYTITGIKSAGYKDTVTLTYRIVPRPITSVKVTTDKNSYEYTGSEIKPVLTLTYNGLTLKENTDYTLSYSENKNIGKGKIKITGIGNFSEEREVTFDIVCQPENAGGFTAKASSYNSILLTFNGNPSLSYEIYRSEKKNGSYINIATVKGSAGKYTDTKAVTGVTYYYKIKAVKTVNGIKYESTLSSPKTATAKLSAPKITKLNKVNGTAIKITWSKTAGAQKYFVYRSTSKSGKYTKLSAVTGTAYTDKTAKFGKTYYYKVCAVRMVDKKTVTGSASTPKSYKLALGTTKITAVAKDNTATINLSKVSGADGYEIYRATSKSGKYTLVKKISSLTFTDKNVKSGKTYYYKTKAFTVSEKSVIYGKYSSVAKIKIK